jgi:hypothetical protein
MAPKSIDRICPSSAVVKRRKKRKTGAFASSHPVDRAIIRLASHFIVPRETTSATILLVLLELVLVATMMMNIDEDEPLPPAPPPRGHTWSSAIVSGDSDGSEDILEETDDDYLDPDPDPNTSNITTAGANPEDPTNAAAAAADVELYDRNLDEEDEAYVYKHLRGGVQETVTVKNQTTDTNTNTSANTTTAKQQVKMYKPRTSDAVLSCPCCFNIVCMDCQRHTRYTNQFRAMFVMGITVDWHRRLRYEEAQQALVVITDPQQLQHQHQLQQQQDMPNQVVPPEAEFISPFHQEDGEYFAVLCETCKTQVAALDLKEELYHFHGCLESS